MGSSEFEGGPESAGEFDRNGNRVSIGDFVTIHLSGQELEADLLLDDEDQRDGSAWAIASIDAASGMANIYLPHVGKTPDESTKSTVKLNQTTRTGGNVSNFDKPLSDKSRVR